MKKLFFFLSVIALVGAGCQSEFRDTSSRHPFDEVGRLHNEGLAYVLRVLQSGAVTKTQQGETDYPQTIRLACRAFLDSLGIDTGLQMTKSGDRFDTTGLPPRFSQRGRMEYEVLMATILNEDNTLSSLQADLDELEYEIEHDGDLTEDDATALLCGVATARASLEYWDEYLLDWNYALNPLDSLPSGNLDGGDAGLQNIIITGNVIDEYGQPMPGVAVRVQGTNQGEVTGLNGDFRMQYYQSGMKLEFTYIGYQMRVLEAKTSMSVRMEEENNFWDTRWGRTLEIIKEDAYGAVCGFDGNPLGALIEGLQRSANAVYGDH